MTPKLFSELGLSPELLKAIDKLGFEQASPIQAEAIPVLMQGLDIVGQSQTGSGKTAAFAIPAIEKTDPQLRVVQVLILCPTRELAVQVSEEVHKLAFFKRGIQALPIYGGQSYERQFYGLRQGAQIVIGTPGRVMDHMRRGTLKLDSLKLVILDEADVMLDMGFREDIEFILQAAPAQRQTVFFAATMAPAIRQLIENYARSPQNVRIEQKTLTVPTVEQVYYEVDRRFKVELLTRLIDIHDLKLGIIFCNTKRMVDDLVDHLEAQGYSADRLHGDMGQAMRDRVMNRFRKSGLEFLVATDVAARGIDVDDVQVVFNYDLPYDVEDYVHRIGRTGRAGRSGMAIAFVSGREVFQIRHIERYTNTRIQRARVPTLNEVEEARANAFLGTVRGVLQSEEYRHQEHLVERLLEEGHTSTDIASAALHLLQGGEAASAAKPPREERRPAAALPPDRERVEPRRDRASETRSRPPGPSRPPEPRRERPPQAGKPVVARTIPTEPTSPPAAEATAEPGKQTDSPEAAVASVPPIAPAPALELPPPPAPAVAKTPIPAAAQPPVPATTKPPAPTTAKPSAPITAKPPTSPTTKSPAHVMAKPPVRPVLPKPPERVKGAVKRPAPWLALKAKPEPGTPIERTRLHMNLGEAMGVAARDVVGAILGETGLPAETVGAVDIRERHLFVEVASEHARAIASKLSRTRIRGHKVKVKVA